MISYVKDCNRKSISMQEQMNNVSRILKTLRKNHKKMTASKNTAIEMKNAFHKLITRLNINKKNTTMNLKIYQRRHCKLNYKDEKDYNLHSNIQEQLQKYNM